MVKVVNIASILSCLVGTGSSQMLYQTMCTLSMHRVLCSAGKDLKGSVFLEALAAREEPNRNGKMTVSLVGQC